MGFSNQIQPEAVMLCFSAPTWQYLVLNCFGCYNSFTNPRDPASVAQLDACPTGDQEIAGLIPAGSATFFHGN